MDSEFEVLEKTLGPVVEIEERISVRHMPDAFGRDFKRISEGGIFSRHIQRGLYNG